MQEKRAAVLLAGVILIGVGLYISTLDAGRLFGGVTSIVGAFLSIQGVLGSIRDRRTGRYSPPRVAAVTTQPGIGFIDWNDETPWGTTPWGLASRIAATAWATAAGVLDFVWHPTVSTWLEAAMTIGTFGVLFVFLFIGPWLAERYSPPGSGLRRVLDRRVCLSAFAFTVLTAVLLRFGLPVPAAVALCVIQLGAAVSVGIFATRPAVVDDDARSHGAIVER